MALTCIETKRSPIGSNVCHFSCATALLHFIVTFQHLSIILSMFAECLINLAMTSIYISVLFIYNNSKKLKSDLAIKLSKKRNQCYLCPK